MKILAMLSSGNGPMVNVTEARAVMVQNATDEDGFELVLSHQQTPEGKVVATVTGPGRHEFDPASGILRLVRTKGESRITVIVECG